MDCMEAALQLSAQAAIARGSPQGPSDACTRSFVAAAKALGAELAAYSADAKANGLPPHALSVPEFAAMMWEVLGEHAAESYMAPTSVTAAVDELNLLTSSSSIRR
jgi:hypothetical protein